MARPDFRATAARRLTQERELSPAIVSLLSPDASTSTTIRNIPLEQIEPNPMQPRLAFDQVSLDELAASIREHGVLQPVLVRPLGPRRFQLIAGERRWRASNAAGTSTIPAMVDDIDDDTAMEIAIIENLQREDLSPLDEAAMYDRMIRDHGYSIRRLAEKLGKDKGYVENRLRLADAPPEIRQLVSVRKDTLSHAYELLKVEDPKKRRRLADQVAKGELSLARLRDKIEGRRARPDTASSHDETAPLRDSVPVFAPTSPAPNDATDDFGFVGHATGGPLRDDSLIVAKQQLADALESLVDVLASPDVIGSIGDVDRANLAKYLTIAKLRLENAIALVRRT